MKNQVKEIPLYQSVSGRRSFLQSLIAMGGTLGLSALSGQDAAFAQETKKDSADLPWQTVLDSSLTPPSFASSTRRILTAPELRDAPDEWIARSFQWINYIFHNFPPGLPELPQRRPALFRLDEILHIESAPTKPLVQQFYKSRVHKAIEEIEKTVVKEGIRFWRIWNHGVLVRTPRVSFTFDIVPGAAAPGFQLEKEWLERLVAQSDATFISHVHGDHANQDVARMFLAAGKPVIAPEGLWSDNHEISSRLIYPKRDRSQEHEIKIMQGKESLHVVSYPGHQGPDVLVNVNRVTDPAGFTVVHTGDQAGVEADFEWISQIGHQHPVDILFINTWAAGLHRMVRGIDPWLVVPSHENEMSHDVAHREEYTQDYEMMFGLNYPFVVLAWGEGMSYQRPLADKGVLPGER
jgi:hypothetical protein